MIRLWGESEDHEIFMPSVPEFETLTEAAFGYRLERRHGRWPDGYTAYARDPNGATWSLVRDRSWRPHEFVLRPHEGEIYREALSEFLERHADLNPNLLAGYQQVERRLADWLDKRA